MSQEVKCGNDKLFFSSPLLSSHSILSGELLLENWLDDAWVFWLCQFASAGGCHGETIKNHLPIFAESARCLAAVSTCWASRAFTLTIFLLSNSVRRGWNISVAALKQIEEIEAFDDKSRNEERNVKRFFRVCFSGFSGVRTFFLLLEHKHRIHTTAAELCDGCCTMGKYWHYNIFFMNWIRVVASMGPQNEKFCKFSCRSRAWTSSKTWKRESFTSTQSAAEEGSVCIDNWHL